MIKKVISIILVFSLLLIIFPVSAVTAGAADPSSFSYKLLDDGTAEITDYHGDDFILELPQKINGYTVTSIGDYAFFDNRNFKKVIIPDTVTNIGYAAFGGFDYECRLQFVEIPDSVETIGDMAFLNCFYLRNVRIPDSVTDIGSFAFGYFLFDLDGDDYYETFYNFSVGAFYIYCSAGSAAYEYAESIGSGYSKLGPTRSGDYLYSILSDGTAEITEYLGDEEEVYIPELIGGCTVTSIGQFAFSGSEIAAVEIPQTVKLIDDCAFYDCPYLGYVEIPEGVETISYEAFENCPNLSEITVPRSVTAIGDHAFGYTFDEQEITWTPNEEGMTIYGYLKRAVLESDDDYSAAEAYAYGFGLTFEPVSQIYGDYYYTVMDDGNAAIVYYFGNEEELEIPEQIEGYPVTLLYDRSFAACFNLKSVHIPSGVVRLGAKAFYYSNRLENVYLPDNLKYIDTDCFVNCIALKKLYMPRSLVQSQEFAYGYYYGKRDDEYVYAVKEDFCAVVYDGAGPLRYCEQSDVNYEFYRYGDADCDGEVSVIDVSCIQRKINKMEFAGEINLNCAVVSGSNELSVIDATLIQRYLAKVGTGAAAPIGEPVPLNPDTVG